MQIWEIARAQAFLGNISTPLVDANQLMREENIYVVVHMLLIFWIPSTIILLCYVIVSCWVYFNSKFTSSESTVGGARSSSTYFSYAVHTAAECTERSLMANGGTGNNRRVVGAVRLALANGSNKAMENGGGGGNGNIGNGSGGSGAGVQFGNRLRFTAFWLPITFSLGSHCTFDTSP